MFTPTAEHAVADAMMTTQLIAIRNGLKWINSKTPDYDAILETESDTWCRFGSVHALFYLQNKYSKLFTHTFLVDSRTEEKGTYKNKDWKYHSYFLVRDQQGIWYAGSPGNYKRDREENPFTRIIVSPNLEDVMETITSLEGGLWPQATTINKAIMRGNYVPSEIGIDLDLNRVLTQCVVGRKENDQQVYKQQFLFPVGR